MDFVPSYPENDKSYLTIEQLGNRSVKISFNVLPEYIWKIAATLSTTVWWYHSGYVNNPKAKKHLNTIAKIANDEIIYKDKTNNLRVAFSSWSDDITISDWFNDVQTLSENYEVILDENNCNPQIVEELLLLLNDNSYDTKTVKEVERWTRSILKCLGCDIVKK